MYVPATNPVLSEDNTAGNNFYSFPETIKLSLETTEAIFW